MNAPTDTHCVQARDLLEMLKAYPEWAHVVLDFDQGENQCRAFIDRAVWSQGKIELKCLFDKDVKFHDPVEIEELNEEIDKEHAKVKKANDTIDTLVGMLERFRRIYGNGVPIQECGTELSRLDEDVRYELQCIEDDKVKF